MNQSYYFVSNIFCSLRAGSILREASAKRKKHSFGMAFLAVLMLSLLGSISAHSQTTYYSKSTAVDFNNVNSWGTANDGTGTSPAAISNADNFIVANNAALSLTGNAAVRQLTINSGSLTVAANALTVSKAGTFDSSFVVNTGGTLTQSGGTITVNGNVLFTNGSSFNQSGGTISVDGNNGGATTGSVATGTNIFAIGTSGTAYSSGTVSLTGGKIIIVDPHMGTGTEDYAFVTFLSAVANNITAAPAHTLQIGDGVSTDAGGSATLGYNVYFWYSTGAFKSGKFVVNAPVGTNRHVTQIYKAIYGGDLTITSGELRITGQTGPFYVAGNIFVDTNGILTNAHTLILGDGNYTSSTGTSNIAVTIPQTVSGTGIFRNAVTSPTANFTSLTINNTSAAGVTLPGTGNIASLPANSVSVSGTLTFTAGKVGTTGNASVILGASDATIGTLSYTSGGFKSGTTFGRWYGATTAGTSITAGTDATGAGSRYPFVNSADQNRSAWIERVTPAAAGGILAMTYNEAAGVSTVNLTDGAFTADRRINDTWSVASLAGTPTAAASFKIHLQATGALSIPLVVANTRIAQGNAFVGAHQAGTVTPGGQRITLTAAELTAAPFSLVYSTAGIPVGTIASGNWNDPAIWNTGVVPTCTDTVYIAANTTVTVNSATAVSGPLTVAANGTLVVASGDLTVGCTLNNTTFTNNGTLNVTGGTLTVNGSMLHAAGSTFNHSAGDINVDGNAAGNAANSVASGTAIVQINTQNVNWTGGMLTIVDPHANATATNTFAYNNSTAHVNVTAGHTIRFGNGTSTDAGGNTTNGFRINTAVGSNRMSLFNVIINGGTGTNRFISAGSNIGINGNMTINAASEYRDATFTLNIGGNLVNNGSYVSTGTLAFQSFLNGTAAPVTVAQTVSGSGTFTNATTAATANFSSLTVNNTSTDGVLFFVTQGIPTQPANAISISGTLTFTAGRLSAASNSFVLGTPAPAAGTLSYTSGGFGPGITFGRWYTATGTGTAFTAGSDATGAASRYPFANFANQDRSAWIERVTPAAAAGVLAITYNNTAGTTAINVTDGTFAVDTKANDTWAVSAMQGTPLAAASFKVQIQAPGIFGSPLGVPTTRIIQGNTFVGAHQAGTVTPGGQRITLTAAELTAAPFTLAVAASDISFTAIASGDWNNPAIWNKNAVPGCNDVVNIGSSFNVSVNSAANVAKSITILTGGTLTIASGDLTVGCTLNNSTFTNNGTLTVTGGTLNINGNMLHASGSTFNHSAGNINVDGNNAGDAATSVASGTSIVQINTHLLNWTGGTLTVVDPHANNTASNSFVFNNSTAHVDVTAGHTLRFGNGVSTDAGGNATNGFRISTFAGSNRISFFNLVIDGGAGTNRFVTSTASAYGINGNLTINANGDYRPGAVNHITGNIVNNGTFVAGSTVTMGTFLSGSTGAATAAQSISGTGTFANLATAATANLTSLTVNNTSTAGVTIDMPLSVSGTLTLTAGKINTTATSMLTLGTATAAGTLSGGSATAYINGPFARTIATGNAATNYILFPVGKAAYAPVWLAPTTTAVSVFKAEAFDTNAGTMDASILNLAAARRWEAPLVSGTFTDIKVRVGSAGIVSTSIPVQAPAAAGDYASAFGSVATYTAGTPNTTQANTAVTAANYTGFLSFADSNACMGVPTPGNTLISATNICAGTAVTLSVQNQTTGSGVTYQWQNSTDGVAFTDIATATGATYSTTPATALYYRLKVTCATGPDMAYSTPVQVTFANTITATTPATRCGTGTVTLGATGSAGTLEWFTAATGGTPVGTGALFTTPSISATTSYYVSTKTIGGSVTVGPASPTAQGGTIGTQTVEWNVNFTVLSATMLQTVDVFPIASGQSGAIVVRTSSGTVIATYPYTTSVSGGATAQTITLNHALVPGNYQLYTTLPSSGLSRNTSGATYPYTSSVANITGNGYDATYFMGMYNWKFESACTSPRVEVVATVTPAPALTLSTATTSICAGQSTAPVTLTAGAADYDTYTWTPATGVTGNSTTGWTFNPLATTTYTLNASQSGGAMCVANAATITVTVNPLPNAMTIAPPAGPVCYDSVVTLTATGGNSGGNAALGNGTTAPSSTNHPNPFNAWYGGHWTQMLYKKAELEAQGMAAGSVINAVAFDFGASVNKTLVDLTIRIGTTTNETTTGGFVPAGTLTTVYNGTYTPVNGATGLVTFNLSTPYTWNGNNNLIVEVVHNAGNNGNGAGTITKTTTTTFDSVYYLVDDGTTPAGVASLQALDLSTITTKGAMTARPNIVFTHNTQNAITWTPAANLYTDAAATTAYVAGTNAATVYAKTNVAGTTTYTATATTAAGCTRTQTVDVTVVNCAIDFANLQSPATASVYTCNSQVVTGQVFKTGVTEAAGAATGMKAWVGVSTTNSDPSTWTEANWHLATFSAQAGNNDEYTYTVTGLPAGTYYLATRNQYLTGAYVYGGTAGFWNGTTSINGTLTVNAVTVPATTDLTYCNEAPTVATLKATVTGTDVKVYTAATGGTALADTTLLVAGTYHVSQTISGCEGPRAEVDVTLNTTVAPATTNATFCNAAPTIADLAVNATGTNLKWYAALTGGTELASTTVLASGDYFVSQTINGCEGPRGTVTVTLNTTAVPTANNITLCSGTTVANLAPAATGTNLKWYAALTGGTELASTTALTAGNYFVSQTINGCEGPRATVTVTIDEITAPVVTLVQTTCTTATGSITVTSPVGAGYTYSIDGTNFQASATFAALAPGTYTVTAKNATNCIAATAGLVINAAPALPTFTTTLTQPTCAVATGSVTVGDMGAAGYTFSIDGTNFQASPTFTGLAAGDYTVTVQTTAGCTATATITINAAPAVPLAPVADATQTFCAGATVANIEVTTGTSLQWYSSLTGNDPIAATTPLVNGTSYFVSQNNGVCESTRTEVVVTITTVLVDDIADQVVACGTYTLPALTNGNYFGGTNGTGTAYTAGQEISSDMTMYIFNQVGECTAETSFTIDVNVVAAPTGEAIQTVEVNNPAEATVADLEVTVTGTLTWYATEADALAGTNPLALTDVLSNGDYFAVQTIGTCSSAPFEVTVTVALGRNDFDIQNIKVYPNPVVEKLVISYSSNITNVEVYDLLGKRVIVEQPNTTTVEINMSHLEAATYIVKVTADGMTKDVKVVKRN